MDSFEVIVRAVIIFDNTLLLCKIKGKDYFFLPGGHIEKGEKTQDALFREIQEELGADIESSVFIGAGENTYERDGMVIQEFNLVFSVGLNSNDIRAEEDHIEFEWVKKEDIESVHILPRNLLREVVKWMDKKETFFAQ